MKKIECIIRPEKLPDVEQALRKVYVGGMTISDVRGFGLQRKNTLNKVKIEIYAIELEVAHIVEAITKAAYTGRIGDGKIAVLPIDQVMRIRTRERDARALV